MYDIVEDLENCRIISEHFFDTPEKTKEYYTKNVEINCYDHHSQFPITKEFIKEVKGLYNNITLRNEVFELQILQDYGQGCLSIPEGYEMLPEQLLEETFDSNVGWFNGYLSLIYKEGDILNVAKLIEAPKIDMEHLRDKCPYSYFLCSKDKEVYIAIYVNYWKDNFIDSKEYIFDTHFTTDDLLGLPNIRKMVAMIPVKTQGNKWSQYEYNGRKILSRNWLASRGWELIGNAWHKEGESDIIDDRTETAYFEQNNKYIWFTDEII